VIEWRAHPISVKFLSQLKNGINEGKHALVYRTEDQRYLQGYIAAMIEVLDLAESNE
jgi:hypothetical protein